MSEFLSVFLLPGMSLWIAAMVFAVFFVSGIIKGFLGIGLPAAAMAFLTLMIDPHRDIADGFADIIHQHPAIFAGAQPARYSP